MYSTLGRNLTTVAEMSTKHLNAIVDPEGNWHERARKGWIGSDIEDEAGRGPEHKVAAFDQALAPH